jgi:hypothetical protein
MKLTQIPIVELATYVGVLTSEQAQSLQGQTFQIDSYFNPIQDINDVWVLSAEEIAYCSNPTFLWVKELDMIAYEPKPTPPLFGGEA